MGAKFENSNVGVQNFEPLPQNMKGGIGLIKALYNLGKVYENKNPKETVLLSLLENPNENKKYSNVIKMKFDFENDEIDYKGLDLEEFSISKLEKYLYKRIGANGGDYTPTSRVTEFPKTLKNMLKAVNRVEILEFKKLNDYLNNEDNFNRILEDVKDFNPKDGYVITFIVNNKWLNEYEEVVNQILSKSNSKYFDKYNKISKKENSQCFCCKKEKNEVYGFVNTYNFYTVDKQGFVAGGFKQENAWKNYPVCGSCAEVLEKGKKFLSGTYEGSFSGFRFMVIPRPIFEINNSESLEMFQFALEVFEEKNKISLESKSKEKELINSEKVSTEAMGEIENNMSFNIMFYDMPQKSVFNILLNIEDVLPSRLKIIFERKEKIEEKDVYLHLKSKNEFKDLKFNFGIFREFFSSDKNFLEIINSVFVGKQISYDFILESFVRNLTEKMNKGESVYFNTRNSLLILEVLDRLNLLKNKKKGEVKEMIEKNEKNQIFLDFLENHKETFDSDIKRAIFLEGVLTQKLLNQPEQRDSKAFYARLNSLKMNEKIVKRIFVEAINKLTEYKKKHYYLELEKMIASYFASSNFKDLSNDEMSYYFVLGMNLVDKFKTKEEELKEEA